jgi:hypothetical protein
MKQNNVRWVMTFLDVECGQTNRNDRYVVVQFLSIVVAIHFNRTDANHVRKNKYYQCVYEILPQLSGMQIAYLLHRFILSSVASSVVPNLCPFSHKRNDFRGKN